MSKTATAEPALDLEVTGPASDPKVDAVASTSRKPKTDVATVPTAANLMTALVDAAANPSVDAAKLGELWKLHKEVSQEEGRLAFLAHFHRLKPNLPTIDQTGRIIIDPKPGARNRKGQNTPFAKWIDIQEGAGDLLNSFNFMLTHSTEPSPDGSRIHVVTTLHHTKGHSWRTVFPLPAETSGSKNNVQGWGASNSYGKRYNTVNLLDLKSRAKEDADSDAASQGQVVDGDLVHGEPITAEQAATLKIKVNGSVGNARFCEKYQIKRVEELPADLYDEATSACENFITEKSRRKGGG